MMSHEKPWLILHHVKFGDWIIGPTWIFRCKNMMVSGERSWRWIAHNKYMNFPGPMFYRSLDETWSWLASCHSLSNLKTKSAY
jgi:hypothetical protein